MNNGGWTINVWWLHGFACGQIWDDQRIAGPCSGISALSCNYTTIFHLCCVWNIAQKASPWSLDDVPALRMPVTRFHPDSIYWSLLCCIMHRTDLIEPQIRCAIRAFCDGDEVGGIWGLNDPALHGRVVTIGQPLHLVYSTGVICNAFWIDSRLKNIPNIAWT